MEKKKQDAIDKLLRSVYPMIAGPEEHHEKAITHEDSREKTVMKIFPRYLPEGSEDYTYIPTSGLYMWRDGNTVKILPGNKSCYSIEVKVLKDEVELIIYEEIACLGANYPGNLQQVPDGVETFLKEAFGWTGGIPTGTTSSPTMTIYSISSNVH